MQNLHQEKVMRNVFTKLFDQMTFGRKKAFLTWKNTLQATRVHDEIEDQYSNNFRQLLEQKKKDDLFYKCKTMRKILKNNQQKLLQKMFYRFHKKVQEVILDEQLEEKVRIMQKIE